MRLGQQAVGYTFGRRRWPLPSPQVVDDTWERVSRWPQASPIDALSPAVNKAPLPQRIWCEPVLSCPVAII